MTFVDNSVKWKLNVSSPSPIHFFTIFVLACNVAYILPVICIR
jgi:hypothetical protein